MCIGVYGYVCVHIRYLYTFQITFTYDTIVATELECLSGCGVANATVIMGNKTWLEMNVRIETANDDVTNAMAISNSLHTLQYHSIIKKKEPNK